MVTTDSLSQIYSDSANKQDQLQQKEQTALLYKAINQLKPAEKALILLYLEEKSYEEIAEITGLTLSNVSVKLVRIKRKLKQLFQSFTQ